ncbi:hypothetical protein [Bacillus sp. EAC]|uniref:hypothetical protein n=1 Tax=Bacillus sp. EAC TaxID=1978338 RepID=UPI000B42E94F|nr:hypothetical protein [Bacillus sp. EAC]
MSLFDVFFNKILVYTALLDDDYWKVTNAFKAEGLQFKVKGTLRNSSTPGQQVNVTDFRAPVMYDFYVKKEDQYKAQKILSHLKN